MYNQNVFVVYIQI